MKKRDYKDLSEGTIYHIYNRGNNKENIFFEEEDYRAFLFRISLAFNIELDVINKQELLRMPESRIRIKTSKEDIFKLHSFCLMSNHFHLLIEQGAGSSISKLMHKICTSFSMYMNKKYKRVGHIFQDRFKSVMIENNPQFMWTSRYIHMNPVKSNLVRHPEEYKWSSYNDFANNRDLPIVYKELINSIFGTKEQFIKETSKISDNSSKTGLYF